MQSRGGEPDLRAHSGGSLGGFWRRAEGVGTAPPAGEEEWSTANTQSGHAPKRLSRAVCSLQEARQTRMKTHTLTETETHTQTDESSSKHTQTRRQAFLRPIPGSVYIPKDVGDGVQQAAGWRLGDLLTAESKESQRPDETLSSALFLQSAATVRQACIPPGGSAQRSVG